MSGRANSPVEEIANIIRSNQRFLLLGHRGPDGDSLCSQLALAECIQILGKTATVQSADPAPQRYEFLPGFDKLIVSDLLSGDYDVVILLECSDFDRTGLTGFSHLPSVNIDHHLQNSMYATCNWVDPKAAAVGEMIFELSKALGVEMTREIATNLYISIVTDTGSFRYSNTTKRTFGICAELLESGIAPSGIAQALYDNEPVEKLKLLAKVLLELEMDPTGQVAWFSLSREETDQCRADGIDTDGFIDFTRQIKGLRVVFFIRQTGDGRFKVSMRSKDDTDVANIALKYGGGGHRNASGFAANGTYSGLLDEILNHIREAFER